MVSVSQSAMEAYFVKVSIFLAFSICVALDLKMVEAQRQPTATALYIFGDSTVDPGNNNALATIVKANFPPYGRDFEGSRPTGRFTNGKLITDFLSGLLGLPDLLPAYLDPFNGQNLLTGVDFASSASGYDDVTSLALSVIPLEQQVENFRLYRSQLQAAVGEDNATRIISGALFGISTGTDDFANNYYINPVTRSRFSVSQYQDLLLNSLTRFVESIIDEGARTIGIVGLPPFGCLPSQILLHSLGRNTCVEEFNQVARSFNAKAEALASRLSRSFPSVEVIYLNVYDRLDDMVKNSSRYGFEETKRGCCGLPLLGPAVLCITTRPTCPDASKYLFWDSFHPTSKAYEIIANDVYQQIIRQLRT